MTEIDPAPMPDDSDEADFIDQHLEIDEEPDLDAELDDPASVELEDDSWDADLADVADQRATAMPDDVE